MLQWHPSNSLAFPVHMLFESDPKMYNRKHNDACIQHAPLKTHNLLQCLNRAIYVQHSLFIGRKHLVPTEIV